MGSGSSQIKLGVVGAGMIGQVAHISNFIQNAACEVVALAELRPRLGQLAAAKFGIPQVYASHRDLLDRADVDAVVVITRRAATGPIVLDALSAGKHVLSEKPMAHTVAQGERLVKAAATRRLRYALGYMKRHDAGTQEARKILGELRQSSELGRIVLVRAYCHGGAFACATDGFVMTDEPRPEGLELWPEAPEWIPDARRADYAWFLNVYSHDINLIRYLIDRPLQVKTADVLRRKGGMVLFDTGDFPVILEMAEVEFDDWREGIEIYFERGSLTLSFGSPMLRNVPAGVILDRAKAGSTRVSVPWSWSFRRQADAFIEDIRLGREPIASGADALEDLRVAEQIWRRQLDG